MTLPSMSLAIVGADFENVKGPTRRFELAMCRPGEPVELRPEPKNPADRHAIAVYSCRGIQLGYVSAERAPRIGQILRQEVDVVAVFQELAPYGGVLRVAFDGEPPALPGAASVQRAEPGMENWDDFDGVDWIPPDD